MASVMRRFGRGALGGRYVQVDGPREAFMLLAQAARQPAPTNGRAVGDLAANIK
jgi:hypothetical protein